MCGGRAAAAAAAAAADGTPQKSGYVGSLFISDQKVRTRSTAAKWERYFREKKKKKNAGVIRSFLQFSLL